jgi:uncharacterized protein YndB with AHSA1/START domain
MCNQVLHIGRPKCYRWLHIAEGIHRTEIEMSTTGYRIEREIVIDAPVEVVWRTVTEPDQISQWFADKVDLEIEPGARGHLGFGDQGGPVLVETVDPPTRFSFRWNAPDGEELTAGNGLLVEFTLAAEGGQTRLRVVEHGIDARPWPDVDKQAYAEEHNGGWGAFLDRLARLLAERP